MQTNAELEQKNAQEFYNQAIQLKLQGNHPTKVIELLTKAAKQKHAVAALELLQLLLTQANYRIDSRNQTQVYEAFNYCIEAQAKIGDGYIKILAEVAKQYRQPSYFNYFFSQIDLKCFLILAKIYKQQGKGDACLAILKEGINKTSDPKLVNMLGDLYYYGHLVEQDLKKSFEIFANACTDYPNQADNYTYYSYALMLHRGQGCTANAEKAIEFYQKSLPEWPAANFALGEIFYNKYLQKRKTNQLDYEYRAFREQAINYLDKSHSAKQGLAYNYIGQIYYNDNNFAQAERYFLKAQENNLVMASFNLAQIYDSGELGAYKQQQANQLYIKAAALGYASAQFKMYKFYASGTNGFAKNIFQAFLMLIKAAKQGHEEAVKILAEPKQIFAHLEHIYQYILKYVAQEENFAIQQLRLVFLLEQKLGYQFSNVALLYQAMDRTIDAELKEARYQLLETLGDGILNASIRFILFKNLSTKITTHKFVQRYEVLINNNDILPKVAQDLQLQEFIKRDPSEAQHPLTAKMLADAIEALCGAILQDNGSMDQTQKVICQLWQPYIKQVEQLIHANLAAALPRANISAIDASSIEATTGFHKRKMSATSIRLQQTITGLSVEEMEKMLKEKPTRAAIVTKQGDTLLHLLAKQTKQLGSNSASLKGCVGKINTLIKQYGLNLDTANAQHETARSLLKHVTIQ